MGAIDVGLLRAAVEFQIDLVHERRRVERRRTAGAAALIARDAAQFLVDAREQVVGRVGHRQRRVTGHEGRDPSGCAKQTNYRSRDRRQQARGIGAAHMERGDDNR